MNESTFEEHRKKEGWSDYDDDDDDNEDDEEDLSNSKCLILFSDVANQLSLPPPPHFGFDKVIVWLV